MCRYSWRRGTLLVVEALMLWRLIALSLRLECLLRHIALLHHHVPLIAVLVCDAGNSLRRIWILECHLRAQWLLLLLLLLLIAHMLPRRVWRR